MFRFSIREAFLATAVVALILGWSLDHHHLKKLRHADAIRPYANKLAEALTNATVIEIGDCGPGMTVKSRVIDGDSLKAFVRSATVVDVEPLTCPISNNMSIELKIRKNDALIDEYVYFYPNTLFSDKQRVWLTMSDGFAKFVQESMLDLGK